MIKVKYNNIYTLKEGEITFNSYEELIAWFSKPNDIAIYEIIV